MLYADAMSQSQAKPVSVKLHRRIGAVAIYSAPRAAALALAVLAVLIGAGYAIGRLTTSSGTTTTVVKRVAVPAKASAAAGATSGASASASRRQILAAYHKGWNRGHQHGLQDATAAGSSAAVASLSPGVPYIVVRGGSALRFRVQVVGGKLYRLCPDGAGICVRPGG